MSDDQVAVDIREAFDEGYEPSPGLEERVVAAIPWTAPRPRKVSPPRLAGALAGALAVVLIGALIAPSVLSRLGLTLPGSGVAQAPYYSLAAVAGDSLFVIQRGPAPANILLQSRDGGRSWVARLHFPGVYDGMQMFGQDGYVWSIDMALTGCNAQGQSCHSPTSSLALYRTADGGATWSELPANGIPVNGIYFLDATHGWIDSGSPATGLGSDTLYATTDAGHSWSLIGSLPNSAPMAWVYGVGQYHVTFSDPLRGWYLGNGTLFTTADGGRTWALVRVEAYTFGGMPPLAGKTLTYSQPVFSGLDGVLPVASRDPNGADNATANTIYLFSSHDGGATWSAQPSIAPSGFEPVGDIVSIAILDPHHFWLTSQSLTGGDNVQVGPAVARTSDGGVTWTVTQPTQRILQMTFRDAKHGFALDVTGQDNVNGILATSDAGATWQRVYVPVFS